MYKLFPRVIKCDFCSKCSKFIYTDVEYVGENTKTPTVICKECKNRIYLNIRM